jgi:hypothetical protein
MIKAVAYDKNGRAILVIGLSFGNLDKLRAHPADDHIRILGEEIGLPVDVMLFADETEAHLAETIKDMIGPKTKVTTGKRLKN